MHIHVVKSGEVLWNIADYYDVDIDSIIEVNNLDNPDLLLVGQSLVILNDRATYVVKFGDTLWNIAKKFGISYQDIKQANMNLYSDLIFPGMILNIPSKSKPDIEVNAFTYFLGEAAVPIVKEAAEYLTYLSPFAYVAQEDGSLLNIDDELAIDTALKNDVIPMMTVINFTYGVRGEDRANKILNNQNAINALLDNIVNIMNEKGYMGLNIDFEYVSPDDREAYNRFLEKAAERMHEEGYFLSTSLAPKTTSSQKGLLYEAHDYEAHGKIADFVIIMTYEWGWRGGYPRAISPIDEIDKVLNYAVSVIPRDKIMMGFQIYARDWRIPFVQGTEADTISIQEAMNLAYENKAEIRYDEKSQSPYFRYTDEDGNNHEVWFEDARSAQAKFDLVKDYGLRGISFWGLGYPFPQVWPLLEKNFNIVKL